MDPITLLLFAGSTAMSAAGQFAAGKAARKAGELNAYNINTDRVRSKAEALMRHNDRLELYRSNLSANLASFAAQGRDIGGDRSVAAFLERQKQVAVDDTKRSDFMGAAEAAKMMQQATAERIEGRARQQAATIGAFTTLASGLYQYNLIK
jgi:hypothetical protein